MIFLSALALPFLLVFIIFILLSEEYLQRDDNHEEEIPAEYGNRHQRLSSTGRSCSRPVEETQQSQNISLLVMPRAETVVQQPAHNLPRGRSTSSFSTRQTATPSTTIYLADCVQASDRRHGELVIAAPRQWQWCQHSAAHTMTGGQGRCTSNYCPDSYRLH